MDVVDGKMQRYAALYFGLNDLNSYAEFVGFSSGTLLTFTADPSMGLKKIALKIVKDNINMELAAEAVLLSILEFYSNNIFNYISAHSFTFSIVILVVHTGSPIK